jgi:hypothetical protein
MNQQMKRCIQILCFFLLGLLIVGCGDSKSSGVQSDEPMKLDPKNTENKSPRISKKPEKPQSENP